ncbi:hypothetical protein BSFA1_79550 (plasmid) [Burkholderia sp. SFA1]|nr:hypothetical protein BYI23_E000620 [Burkholderia sp. YI23]BBQ02827.1 hypothetical protein BSFA1_79550 [Burkholderia sp. SFA1]
MRRDFAVIVALAGLGATFEAVAQGLFYTKTTLPPLNGTPAKSYLRCNKGMCTQRILVEVGEGSDSHVPNPECMVGDGSFPWKDVIGTGTKTYGAAHAGKALSKKAPLIFVTDYGVKVAGYAADRGVIRGTPGAVINSFTSKKKTARCAAIGAALPPKAKFLSVKAWVFRADEPALRKWFQCDAANTKLYCDPPAYCGWNELPTYKDGAVGGVFKNWQHNGRRWVAMDISFRR